MAAPIRVCTSGIRNRVLSSVGVTRLEQVSFGGLRAFSLRLSVTEQNRKIYSHMPWVKSNLGWCRQLSTDTIQSQDGIESQSVSEDVILQENSDRKNISEHVNSSSPQKMEKSLNDAGPVEIEKSEQMGELPEEFEIGTVSDDVSAGEPILEDTNHDLAEKIKENIEEAEGEPDALYRKVAIEIKSHEKEVLNRYFEIMMTVAKEMDITKIRKWRPPQVTERITVLKSAHVHKKHRAQYEMRTHHCVAEIFWVTGSTADTYLEYIQRHIPEGIAMKVTKHQVSKLPEDIIQAMVN